MGRVEEVTLPTRFILTVVHLIATLTIVYDVVRCNRHGHRWFLPTDLVPANRRPNCPCPLAPHFQTLDIQADPTHSVVHSRARRRSAR
jgi:hypothetical protein